MSDLVVIGYPDEATAEAAAEQARHLADDLTVLKTSLSRDDEAQLQEALHGGGEG